MEGEVMGTQQRRAGGSPPLRVQRYRVRRWTAFEWSPPLERDAADRWYRDKEANLSNGAVLVQRKLRESCPDWSPSVSAVRVERRPELLFELYVMATDEDDARKRAMYRIGRALTVKVPAGGQRVSVGGIVRTITVERTLEPPAWGKCEVEVVEGDG